MEFKGRVLKVFDRTFTKKDGSGDVFMNELWLQEQTGAFPQSGLFELKGGLVVPREGDTVTIQFSMSTREWNDKVFSKNRAWSIQIEPPEYIPTEHKEAPVESEQPTSGNTALPF